MVCELSYEYRNDLAKLIALVMKDISSFEAIFSYGGTFRVNMRLSFKYRKVWKYESLYEKGGINIRQQIFLDTMLCFNYSACILYLPVFIYSLFKYISSRIHSETMLSCE